MSDLIEFPVEHLLHQTVPEVVLLEPRGSDDLLEVPTEDVLYQLGQDNTLLEPLETLVLLTAEKQGPPGPPGTGAPKSPTLTYTGSQLTGLAYADGSTKTLAYVGGRLVQVDFSPTGAAATRKTLHYDGTGRLAQVSETTVP